MKPMMWMGRVSGWAALGMGAMFAVNAYFQFASGGSGWAYVGAAVLLGVGGFRTLKRMSGGLRLLSGAWGFAAGLLVLRLLNFTEGAAFDTGGAVFAAIALTCLALTVLHKEK
jgi:hypothetical protein